LAVGGVTMVLGVVNKVCLTLTLTLNVPSQWRDLIG
jgi:hypothetical protein